MDKETQATLGTIHRTKKNKTDGQYRETKATLGTIHRTKTNKTDGQYRETQATLGTIHRTKTNKTDGQYRETHATLGTIHRNEGPIKNEQLNDTGNIGHQTQNEDKQNKQTHHRKLKRRTLPRHFWQC